MGIVMVLVSVIIPVYNRKKFCVTALEMLRAQTLKNIEFIIVDDGSTDGTYEYLTQNTHDDSRFQILRNKSNIGPSGARNAGLNVARGEYIGFFDIDDEIPSDYFEQLYNLAVSNNADVVFASYNNLKHQKTGTISNLSDKISVLRNGAIWDKLFKRDLIKNHDIQFPVGFYCADNVFVLKCFYYASNIYLCNSPVYKYVLSADSIGNDAAKMKKRKSDILYITDLIYSFAMCNNFNSDAITQVYHFLNRTFNKYASDRKFCNVFNNALVKFNQTNQKVIKIKEQRMLFLKLRKWLGIITQERYEDLKMRRRIKKSKLFDKKWYLAKNPDVAAANVDPVFHYLQHGWREGRNPSPKFDNNAYLADNPDVAAANACPLIHYINFGFSEGRYVRAVSGDAADISAGAAKHTEFWNRLGYALQYPVRVRDEYYRLRTEIKALKNKD